MELPPSSRLGLLPASVARSILQSTVSDYQQQELHVRREGLTSPFLNLALVSKEWFVFASDASAAIALRSLSLSVAAAKRSEFLAARRAVTLQRRYLRSLSIKKTPITSHYKKNVDQWAAVLACASRLEELLTTEMKDAPFQVLGGIVQAAGRQCTGLQSLVLAKPFRNGGNQFYPTEELRRNLTIPLHEAMDQLAQRGASDGLRRLCVSRRFDLQNQKTITEYITKVIENFPKLEIFDGYKAAVTAMDQRTCYELYMVDLALWTRFCASLTQLKEFDWVCVPFATKFFEIFSQFPKPKMKKLILTTAMNWKWEDYHKQVGAATTAALEESGYGANAKNIHTVLRACPNLEELMVWWYNAAAEEDNVAGHYPSYRYPTAKLMDPEIFNDVFCETLAKSCPRLHTLSITAAVEGMKANRPIASFTDRSMRALATLPWLTTVDLDTVNVTGDGVFELVMNHAAATRERRSYMLEFCEAGPEIADSRFYVVILVLLQKLATCEAPLPCLERDVTLHLTNHSKANKGLEWSEQYLAEIKPLLAQVRAKYPTLVVNVFANDCDGTKFSRIEQLMLCTKASTMQLWFQQGDTEQDVGVWSRRVELPGMYDDYYDDDYDEDEDDFDEHDDMSDDFDEFMGDMDEDFYGDSDGDMGGDY